MDKCLFMVCPTDHLEPAIDHWFEGFKYYYSSLGNTFSLDEKTLCHISDLIEKNGIGQIMVILSENNRIVLDALNKRQYVEITGLAEPYGHLIDHKKHVVNTWQAPNQSQLVLSRHLNQK